MRRLDRALIAGIIGLVGPLPFAQAQSPPILFHAVRLFDGHRIIPSTDVLVSGGLITRVGPGLAAPGALRIEGAGKTLLPGLIDAHAHVFGAALTDALMFGVTTELDMFTDHTFAAAKRKEQAEGGAAGRADLYSAGTLVTSPKGHGTEYGMVIPTISTPDEAQAFVDARLAEGSDYIKIVYDDGSSYGFTSPTISKEVLGAVIKAAHARKKLAVVHIGSQQDARDALEAGADGLVHTFEDSPPAADIGSLAARRHAFVTPTLTVNASVAGIPVGATLLADSAFARGVSPENIVTLRRTFTRRPGAKTNFDYALASVRAFHAAGVPILAGTDAPNPGTAHGASLHQELELLVKAGLTPTQALHAATAGPAQAYRLADRGRIAAGLRADLLLVEGDPSTDITTTRRIVGVWKAGKRTEREAFLTAQDAARRAGPPAATAGAPSGSEAGAVSTFDDGSTRAAFGGWSVSTDDIAGGKSTATITAVDGGAQGSKGALKIAGTIAPPFAYPWAGAMFSPGPQPMAPADLSAKKEIRFWAKGDGKQYRVMMFAASRGQMPLTQTFVAGPEWTEQVLALASFGGIDGHDLMAVIFSAGPALGGFELYIDQVSFR
ncbi:MAG: amidohydrolase family protein [Gemmatimonadota bacterium]